MAKQNEKSEKNGGKGPSKKDGKKLPYQKPSIVKYERLSRVWGMQE